MLRRAAALALPALMLAACGTTLQSPFSPPTPPVRQAPPPGALRGHGAFRLASGARVSCAGLSVALTPDQPRYRRRVQALYDTTDQAMEPVGDVKARSARLPPSPDTAPIASAACDAHGEFSFPALAADDYFVIAHVKVRPPENGNSDYVIMKRVAILPSEATDVSLAP
jgi:hypothetical protein